MGRKRKAGAIEEADPSNRSIAAQKPGRQADSIAGDIIKAQATASEGTDGRSSEAADATEQGADETSE
jgi:hypothetical protein